MNELEKNIVGRFASGWEGKQSNTESHDNTLYLNGHAIAWRNEQTGEVWITNAGWHTKTTQSRLNAVLNSLMIEARVFTKNKRHYLERMEDNEMVTRPMTQWIEVKWHHLSNTLKQLQESVAHG
tara:strand:+ start:474 stop:845 length:372 start_codon:yes stop_codon:yes gene_type:complete